MRDGTLTGISLSRPLPSGLITAEFSNADTQQQIRKVTSQSLSYLFIYQLIVALLQFFFRSVYTWNELIDHFFHLTKAKLHSSPTSEIATSCQGNTFLFRQWFKPKSYRPRWNLTVRVKGESNAQNDCR